MVYGLIDKKKKIKGERIKIFANASILQGVWKRRYTLTILIRLDSHLLIEFSENLQSISWTVSYMKYIRVLMKIDFQNIRQQVGKTKY